MDVATLVSLGTLVAMIAGGVLFVTKSREVIAVLRADLAAHTKTDDVAIASVLAATERLATSIARLDKKKASKGAVRGLEKALQAFTTHADSRFDKLEALLQPTVRGRS